MRVKLRIIIALSLIVVASGCASEDQSNIKEYTLEIEEPKGEGEVTPDVGTHNFTKGESAELNATSEGPWKFIGWEINGSILSSNSNVNLSMNNDVQVKPIFEIPAEFKVEELSINKQKVKPGEKNVASVTVSNIGGSTGTYDLILSSESNIYDSKSIELGANESESFNIEFREDEEADHTITLEGEQESFTVDSATFISDAESFVDIRNNLDGEYKLTSDIDLSNIRSDEFAPIGDGENKFTGMLDGQRYSVSNYKISSPYTNYVGLFGFVGDEGEIKNLDVTDFNVEGEEYVAGLVAVNNGEISDSSATGKVTAVEHVGGLVGHNWEDGRILRSESDVSVDGDRYIGGLVGDNDNLVSESTSYGIVEGLGWVGGITGRNLGKVADSDSDAEVTGSPKVAYGEASMDELEEKSTDLDEITYEGLLRSPSKHESKLIRYEGSVVQIIDNDNTRNYHLLTDFYINEAYNVRVWNSNRIKSYWKTEHAEENFTTFDFVGERLLKEDTVRVYGMFKGLYEYETTQGNTNTVPNVEIRHIEQIDEL